MTAAGYKAREAEHFPTSWALSTCWGKSHSTKLDLFPIPTLFHFIASNEQCKLLKQEIELLFLFKKGGELTIELLKARIQP